MNIIFDSLVRLRENKSNIFLAPTAFLRKFAQILSALTLVRAESCLSPVVFEQKARNLNTGGAKRKAQGNLV